MPFLCNITSFIIYIHTKITMIIHIIIIIVTIVIIFITLRWCWPLSVSSTIYMYIRSTRIFKVKLEIESKWQLSVLDHYHSQNQMTLCLLSISNFWVSSEPFQQGTDFLQNCIIISERVLEFYEIKHLNFLEWDDWQSLNHIQYYKSKKI